MNILICPNAFKGALEARAAAAAIRRGLEAGNAHLACRELPIADGGDGSLELAAYYLGAELINAEVDGPFGRKVIGRYGWVQSSKTALVELAEASGIRLISRQELNPLMASTYGTGQLIQQALAHGATQLYLMLGGSATVDGAMGILNALGVVFFENDQVIHRPTPVDFLRITHFDASRALEQLEGTTVRILCDVINPLLGSKGAAAVFAPQKGADEKQVKQLSEGLAHFARLIQQATGRAIGEVTFGGAAGGVAAGLQGVLGAELVHGGEQVLGWCGFNEALEQADVVITGEGRIDTQTEFGKGPGLVAQRAKAHGRWVIGLSGFVAPEEREYPNFDLVLPVCHGPCSLEEAMAGTAENLERTGFQLGRMLVPRSY